MKLIKMTEYILTHPATMDYAWFCGKMLDYANFLQTPLTLGMFVACDLDGNVLEEPIETIGGLEMYCEQTYNPAKERIMFEGFEIHDYSDKNSQLYRLSNSTFTIMFSHFEKRMNSKGLKKIEDLTKESLTLTQSAIKQLELWECQVKN